MLIYLVRHGEAVPAEADPSRPLSEKGRSEVEATAKQLLAEGAQVSEIWHSSKLRARQTAEIIARVLNVTNVIEKKGLKPDDPATPIAELLRQTDKIILIAGHLPFIPKLVQLLKPELGKVELKTGGVVGVEADIDRNSPRKFYLNGKEYFDAAKVIIEKEINEDKFINVKLYLLCHSLELYLKAYLRYKGLSIKKLKKEIGHDLEKAFNIVKENGLNIDDLGIGDAKWFNLFYCSKDLEYSEGGFKGFPAPTEVISAVEKIGEKIRSTIMK